MENKKGYFGAVIFILIIGVEGYFIYNKTNLHVFFCRQKKKIKPVLEKSIAVNEKIYVELYKVEKEEKDIIFDTYGTIVGDCEYPIIFENSGKISYISPERQVEKGEILLSLDVEAEECRKKGIEAALDAKQKKLERTKDLVKNNIVSISDLQQLEAEIAELESKIEEIDIRIKQMSILAVEDGYFFLNNSSSSVGALVNARQQIGWFFSKKKFIKFFLPHEFLKYIKEEEVLKVMFFPEFSSSATPLEGEFKISLEYLRPLMAPENEYKNSLCEGLAQLKNLDIPPYYLNQNGKIHITFNRKEPYVLVPEIAVFNRGIKNFVYVVQDGRAILTEIEIIGPVENGFFKVGMQYLSGNTTIVLRGLNKVQHMSEVASLS